MTFDLLPHFTAPGKQSDMLFITSDKFYSIETTIHRREKDARNNEVFQCFDHVKGTIDKYNMDGVLFFVSFFNKDTELCKQFKYVFAQFNQNNIRQELFKFNELKNIKQIK